MMSITGIHSKKDDKGINWNIFITYQMKNDRFEMLNYTGEPRNVQYMSMSSYQRYSTLRLLPHEVTALDSLKRNMLLL